MKIKCYFSSRKQEFKAFFPQALQAYIAGMCASTLYSLQSTISGTVVTEFLYFYYFYYCLSSFPKLPPFLLLKGPPSTAPPPPRLSAHYGECRETCYFLQQRFYWRMKGEPPRVHSAPQRPEARAPAWCGLLGRFVQE